MTEARLVTPRELCRRRYVAGVMMMQFPGFYDDDAICASRDLEQIVYQHLDQRDPLAIPANAKRTFRGLAGGACRHCQYVIHKLDLRRV
jgi:hypothetical protein